MKEASSSTLRGAIELMNRFSNFLRTLYLFGKSDIPVAAIPSVSSKQRPLTKLILSRSIVSYSPRAHWFIRLASSCERTALEPIAFAYLPGMYKASGKRAYPIWLTLTSPQVKNQVGITFRLNESDFNTHLSN